MARGEPPEEKLFTVEEANAALPLVRAIVRDLAYLARDVIERRQRLDHLLAGRRRRPGDPYDEELAAVERQLEKDTARLREYVGELRALGVAPKGAAEGLVDFPAELDGRRVYLCWKLGEPEVLYWHERDAGFAGRRPLTADTLADEGGPGQGGGRPG